MLRQTIQDQIKEAMRAKDTVRLEALRFVWSEIKNKEIDKHADLTEEEILALLQKEVKNRSEAIADFKRGQRDDLVSQEEAKLVVIKAFLPEQMGADEIGLIVDEVISGGEVDFGKVMGLVMARVKGKADGTLVSGVVRERLTKA